MNKRLTKIMTMGATGMLSVGMLAGPAMAAAGSGNDYTPVAGSECTFEKFLIMDEGDSVPNATFAFTIAPGSARSADTASNSVMQVLPGVGTPTITNVTFAPGDATKTSATGSAAVTEAWIFDGDEYATEAAAQAAADAAQGAAAGEGDYSEIEHRAAAPAVAGDIDVQRTNVDRGGSAGDAVQFDSGEKYAQKTATIDFSGVTFDEPGIYRYIVTETANAQHAAAGIIHDTDSDRVLDVYVTDDGSGNLAVSSYVLHTTDNDVTINASMGSADVATALAAVSDKTDGFTNEYTSKDLKVEKEVTGNQGSKDKYFEFTVTVSGINASDSYVVSIADDNNASTNDGNASATSGTNSATIAANAGKTNPTVVTGADLIAGQKFYLQHGQSVVIRGLAPDATYTVTENAEDYASAVKTGDTNSGVIGTVAGANKMATAGFTNNRNGIVPTGILFAVIPGLIAAGAGGTGAAAIKAKRRREENEVEIDD